MKIQEFCDMDKFEQIMKNWAESTGLATVAVGADGEYISDCYNFTEFCIDLTRKSPEGCRRCEKCDREGKGVYFCHAGLIDFGIELKIGDEVVGSNVVTSMAGDFKTVQIRILIAVIEKLQDVIELSIQHLDKYGTSIPCEQLSLFQEYSDRIRVDIAYRDLGVNPDQYKEVKSMVRKLISIPVELDVKDPITGEDSWSITGLFTKANIPKTPYSRGFSLEMDREVAKVFINVDRGFTRYIKEIALRAQSRYTIRMYMLISSWKEKGGFSIYVDRFRNVLGK